MIRKASGQLRSVLASLAMFFAAYAHPAESHFERSTPVPKEFFGLIIHRAHTTTPWPAVAIGSWMLWDSYVKWSDIEPAEDDWQFEAFDRQVELGLRHGVELSYTLGQTPPWASTLPGERFAWGLGVGAMPKNISSFARYVAKVAARYKGQIAAYQVWNEPKLGAPGTCRGTVFFCGSADDLAALTRVAREELKRHDPGARLLSPAFTGSKGGVEMLDRYLATGAGRWLDAIGFHFYDLKPEDMLRTVGMLRAVMAKHGLERLPIWNTEVGYLIQDDQGKVVAQHDAGVFSRVHTDTQAAALLARVLLLQAAAGIDRVHWYAWDDQRMGLVRARDARPNAAGVAFDTVRRWLVGATLRCGEQATGNWQCTLARAGRQAVIVWRTDGGTISPLPGQGLVEDLAGVRVTTVGSHPVPLLSGPVLYVADGRAW